MTPEVNFSTSKSKDKHKSALYLQVRTYASQKHTI